MLTAGAIGTTAYSGKLGRDIAAAGKVDAAGGTVPSAVTPSKAAEAMRQQRALQWATPALTAAPVIASALQGEQQLRATDSSGLRARRVPASGADAVRHRGTER